MDALTAQRRRLRLERLECRNLLAQYAFNVNLYTDNDGVPGDLITDDAVEVGDTFFVEVTAEDLRPNPLGLQALGLGIYWNPAVLEEVDPQFDPAEPSSPLVTDKFPLFRGGTLDNESGSIDQLGGLAMLSTGDGAVIGDDGPERFALLHFRADTVAADTPLVMRLRGGVGMIPMRQYTLEDLMFESQTIDVVLPAHESVHEGPAATPASPADGLEQQSLTPVQEPHADEPAPSGTDTSEGSGKAGVSLAPKPLLNAYGEQAAEEVIAVETPPEDAETVRAFEFDPPSDALHEELPTTEELATNDKLPTSDNLPTTDDFPKNDELATTGALPSPPVELPPPVESLPNEEPRPPKALPSDDWQASEELTPADAQAPIEVQPIEDQAPPEAQPPIEEPMMPEMLSLADELSSASDVAPPAPETPATELLLPVLLVDGELWAGPLVLPNPDPPASATTPTAPASLPGMAADVESTTDAVAPLSAPPHAAAADTVFADPNRSWRLVMDDDEELWLRWIGPVYWQA